MYQVLRKVPNLTPFLMEKMKQLVFKIIRLLIKYYLTFNYLPFFFIIYDKDSLQAAYHLGEGGCSEIGLPLKILNRFPEY